MVLAKTYFPILGMGVSQGKRNQQSSKHYSDGQ
jgi:hypothetical protein